MYKLTLSSKFVQRLPDGAFIPLEAPSNGDTMAYAKWLAEGNTAAAADPLPPPTQEQLDVVATRADIDVQALSAMSPAQASAWVQANINTLADAKQFLKRVAILLAVLAKRI